ncbi:PLP-dependent aminotransferase family protein [Tumebacillus permanentifrigoris]|uniref:GntR family transcriptional regulator/MocR family aminotransferase n=1 Tax=Tumebacillus permanentifrigoris TaxID=378543 RepID=A0A316D575_9BACL|nr:PLP-dependent aminotransferase family protein [Tumebacillus permanentifrigoris]PWK05285.1 GntR family transcriptional regulator/MocR family aminotransferase [Tumebacillus permanentifrigoris]
MFNIHLRDLDLEKYRYKYLALYHALREGIVTGSLPHGTKLPASRELAAGYEISRGVVSQVYEMLMAEGYLSAEVGRGTHVSFQRDSAEGEASERAPILLSKWGQRVTGLPLYDGIPTQTYRYDYTIGQPLADAFPFAEWNRAMYAAIRDVSAEEGETKYEPQGYRPLREAIARYLRKARGMVVQPEDIVIVNGSMQAIALVAQLLIDPGDSVVLEDPAYGGIREAITAVGGQPVPSPVDGQGLVVRDWEARLLFVTPGRQFPTGTVLSLERRQEILRWATARHAVIVEDDYDSEFRWRGRPIEPLKVLDRHDRVVYIGTFSKTMYADLRIGYVVLPSWLREPFCKARQLYEPRPTALVQQHALAAFMNNGHYERHLRRMKRVYARKHKILWTALTEEFGALFDWVESDAGLHIFGRWRRSLEEYQTFREACLAAGVRFPDATRYYATPHQVCAACFGFQRLGEEQLVEGVEVIAQVWAQLQR